MKYRFLFFCVVLLVTLTGCSDQVALSGKVTYQDGSPLTVGEVVFSDGKNAFRGMINPKDGSYRMGGVKDNDGILPGNYKIYIALTEVMETSPDGRTSKMIEHVAKKYHFPETSELTCEVKGKTVFDFTVEKP